MLEKLVQGKILNFWSHLFNRFFSFLFFFMLSKYTLTDCFFGDFAPQGYAYYII